MRCMQYTASPHVTCSSQIGSAFSSKYQKAPFCPIGLQLLYNSANILEDLIIDEVPISSAFENDLFQPQPQPQADGRTSGPKPARSPEYPRSEVHEFFEAGLWGGPFDFNTSNVVASHPVPGLDSVHAVYVGYGGYVQLVVEFENGDLVTYACSLLEVTATVGLSNDGKERQVCPSESPPQRPCWWDRRLCSSWSDCRGS